VANWRNISIALIFPAIGGFELIRAVTKVVAGIAAVVFILARFTTTTGVLLFAGSIVVLLVCFGVLKLLEDEDEDTGYWPDDPKQ
jgi:hypothetical protein